MMGPARLVPLLKFWVCFSVVEAIAELPRAYMTLLRLSWVVSVPRAVLLMLFASGPSLGFVEAAYERIHQKLDEREEIIEAERSRLQERAAKNGKAFVDIIEYLLQRFKIGGFTAVIEALQPTRPWSPSKFLVPSDSREEQVLQNHSERQPEHQRLVCTNCGRSRSSDSACPCYMRAARDSTICTPYQGIIVRSTLETPRIVYTDSRKLREDFRKRAISGSPYMATRKSTYLK